MNYPLPKNVLQMYSEIIPKNVLQILPKNVLQMYSEIWLPDRLDSEKWLSSLLSIRLN